MRRRGSSDRALLHQFPIEFLGSGNKALAQGTTLWLRGIDFGVRFQPFLRNYYACSVGGAQPWSEILPRSVQKEEILGEFGFTSVRFAPW